MDCTNSVITNKMDVNNIQHIKCDKYLLSSTCDASNVQSLLKSELKNTKVCFEDRCNSLIVGEHSSFEDCGFYVSGRNNEIIIGSNCRIKGTYFILLGDNNKIIIGDNVTTNGLFWGYNYIHCTEGHTLKIGSDCMFSGDIVIRNSDGHSVISDGKRINQSKDITIGNHVWIGMRATLLKGAYVGSNCIIGANAVITKKFENDLIIVGNPAMKKKLEGTWIRENI